MSHPRLDTAAFNESLAELERRIAEAEAAGEEVPPEAREMLMRLRDLVAALGGLADSIAEPKPDDTASGEPT